MKTCLFENNVKNFDIWIRSATPWVSSVLVNNPDENWCSWTSCKASGCLVNVWIKVRAEEGFESCVMKTCAIMVFDHYALQMTNHLSC